MAMIPFPFVKGMDFHEVVCLDKEYIERLITLACRCGLDPIKSMTKLNQGAPKVVAKIHTGKLVEYEEVGPQRQVLVKDIEHVESWMTIVRVKFEDGLEGWTYRSQTSIDPRQLGKKPTKH